MRSIGIDGVTALIVGAPSTSARFESWREQARDLLRRRVPPISVRWSERGVDNGVAGSESQGWQPDLFAAPIPNPSPEALDQTLDERGQAIRLPEVRVSREFMTLAETVAAARDPGRWALLYRLLWRLNFEEKNLLEDHVDDDVFRARQLERAIRRDIHKMHAFVRFKRIDGDAVERYVAWHRPEHEIVELGTPFFARRFGDRCWSILTPEQSAHWDGQHLSFAAGVPASGAPGADELEELWTTYYRSIFNPARIKIKAMKAEMPVRHWATLPEAAIIDELLREAPSRLRNMAAKQNLAAQPPPSSDLTVLKAAAQACQACPLHRDATQTVFGEGPSHARLMIVGEQPGDYEDQRGSPFVGPAGQLLDEAFAAAGVERSNVYLTNAVKHFKWKPQGERRLHQKPSGAEMHACRPWLEAEIESVEPTVILALGQTAANSLLGRTTKISQDRLELHELGIGRGPTARIIRIQVSWHPSALLREQDTERRKSMFKELVADLRRAFDLADESASDAD